MAADPALPPDNARPYRSDTKRTTPRRFLLIALPLAVVALVILILGFRYIGHTL